jgi:rsbT co-antagonist protein RsbR
MKIREEEPMDDAMLALAQVPTLPEGDILTLQQLVDGIPDPMFFKDRQHRWIAFNRAFCDMLGRPHEELYCRSDPDFFPPEQVAVFWKHDDLVFDTGRGDLNEEVVTRADGAQSVLWTRKTAVRDLSGAIVGLSGIIMDVSDHQDYTRRTAALEAEATRQRSIIEAQERLIDDLVVPVLEVWEGILLLPLVGGLTHGRAAHVIESALLAVSQRATKTVIIDVTGAGTIDTEVAELLVRTVRAIRLLGCRSIVVGVSPASARTLVQGGTDLGAMTTCGTLKQGLSLALAERRE